MLSETNEVDVTSASKLKLQLSTEDGTAALKQALLDSPFLALYDVAPTVAEQKVGMLLERIASDFEDAKGDFDNDKSREYADAIVLAAEVAMDTKYTLDMVSIEFVEYNEEMYKMMKDLGMRNGEVSLDESDLGPL